MSINQKSSKPRIDRLAQKLVELVEMFRKKGPASDYQWWGKEIPRTVYTAYPGYQPGQNTFNQVVEGVLKLNPSMLSKYEVEWKLTYVFLKEQASSPDKVSGQELMNRAKAQIDELVEFEAWQDIDVPIMNLLLEGEPVKLGYVTFVSATEEDIELWQEKNYAARVQGIADIQVLARVRAPGDMARALSYTRAQVNLALDVLRVLCFPFGPFKDRCGIAALGDIESHRFTPIRINQEKFAIHFENPYDMSGYAKFELRKDILSKLKQPQLALLNKLILKTEDSRSKMENKLLDGIHWLAESTKSDSYRARFAKISFALETLISGEPNDEMLQVRGITAMLAERAAFIAGRVLKNRKRIDEDIREYYGVRGAIVHGDKPDVSLNDINEFGILLRRLSLALLEKLDKLGDNLKTVDDLERWVKDQRYTLRK